MAIGARACRISRHTPVPVPVTDTRSAEITAPKGKWMRATHLDAEGRYEALRQESRIQAQSVLPPNLKGSVSLKGIDQKALIHAKAWEHDYNRTVNWEWQEGYNIYKMRYPKRFELSIWKSNILCGLSIGRPSYHGTRLRLDFAERAPSNCPIRGYVMQLILLGAESYALNIGAEEVRIMHPLNERLVNYYNRLGYKYIEGAGEVGSANERKPHFLYKLL